MRKFLVILDDTPECVNAMRYAAIRASKTTGGVEILAIINPEDFQHFMGVADVMRAEAHEKIEAHFQVFKDAMEKSHGITPRLSIREGDPVTEIIEHIRNDPGIGILVLGAATGKEGPGPLVSQLVARRMSDMPVPITVVPGNLSKEDILAVS